MVQSRLGRGAFPSRFSTQAAQVVWSCEAHLLCVCVCMCVRVYVCVHVYVCAYVHVYMRVCNKYVLLKYTPM